MIHKLYRQFQASNRTALSMTPRRISDRLNCENFIGIIYYTDICIASGPEADRVVLELNVFFQNIVLVSFVELDHVDIEISQLRLTTSLNSKG